MIIDVFSPLLCFSYYSLSVENSAHDLWLIKTSNPFVNNLTITLHIICTWKNRTLYFNLAEKIVMFYNQWTLFWEKCRETEHWLIYHFLHKLNSKWNYMCILYIYITIYIIYMYIYKRTTWQVWLCKYFGLVKDIVSLSKEKINCRKHFQCITKC